MTYVITDMGPLDDMPAGTDVTGIYKGDLLERLIDEGYIAEQGDEPLEPEPVDEPEDVAAEGEGDGGDEG